ncbi:YciI family protein [Pseudonocardia sp. RS11V-5]|uniref:YciI family protein n=1 Tax=Pseudonocardia terrae TaxID=2905831 RepID=UPI001E34375B|nr:YciI family protein [Pseudonocardia terrae]MCE3551041.1 YciI family protein [Pseudonocardia terrae]
MRYALLIHELPGAYDGFDDAQRTAITAEYTALRDDERVLSGERLQPVSTATTVRAGGLLTDGPFADTKEVFGGFFLVEAPDLDSALELAGRVPAVRLGGSVEVRPLAEPAR